MKTISNLTNRFESNFVINGTVTNVKKVNTEQGVLVNMELACSEDTVKEINEIFAEYKDSVKTVESKGEYNGAQSLGCITIKDDKIRLTANASMIHAKFSEKGDKFESKLFLAVKGEEYESTDGVKDNYKQTGLRIISFHNSRIDKLAEQVKEQALIEALKATL